MFIEQKSYNFQDKLRELYTLKGVNLNKSDWKNIVIKDMISKGLVKYDEGEFAKPHTQQRYNYSKQLQYHLNGKPIGVEWIGVYCEYFNCSADYFLGYIEAPTHAATDIGRETGLSTKSIRVLQRLQQIKSMKSFTNETDSVDPLDTLNNLLSKPGYASALFYSIGLYLSPKFNVPALYDENNNLIIGRKQTVNQGIYDFWLVSEKDKEEAYTPVDRAFLDTVNIQRIKDYLDGIRKAQ